MKRHFPMPVRLPPQLSHAATTRAMMLDVLIALLPALGMAVFFFGPRVLVLTAVSMLSCAGFEALYRRLTRQTQTVHDLSACVTGMILAMCLPASSSYWVPILGAAFSILVVKQFYGGLGKNFMNPALAGRMLLATFPVLMTTWPQSLHWLSLGAVDAVSAATPLSYLHEGLLPPETLSQLFLGQQGGCLGEVSSFMLLLGGFYLIARRVISPRIPGAYLGTVAVLALLFPKGDGGAFVWMLTQLLSGGLLLGAFFLATDPTTSPVTPRGQLFFGVGCGVLTMLLRYHSSYPEGVGWAILTMNCGVWLLDRAGFPRRFGVARFSVVKGRLRRLRASLAEIKFIKPDLPHVHTGQMPGEAHLDQIRTTLRTLSYFGGVLLVTVLVIFAVDRATDLDTARAEAQQQQELLTQAMPQAVYRSEVPYRANGALSITAGYSSDNQLVGYCVEVQAQGFGGVITMVVGVDLDGKVTGVAVTDHHETIDVGEKALTDEALSRYVGRSGTIRTSGSNTVDVVSGATATSKALTAGVNRALAIVASLDTSGDSAYYEDSEG
jgi:RnfABCDGE-type electron transport complex D subunit